VGAGRLTHPGRLSRADTRDMTERPDVVGRAEDEGAAPTEPMPPALRALVFVAVGLIAVVVLTRTDLLSSDRTDRSALPTPSPSATRPTTTSNLVVGPPRPVVRWNDALAVGLPYGVRADRPVIDRIDKDTELVAVSPVPEPGGARDALLGVARGSLVRVDVRSGDVTQLGPASAVVDAAAAPGRALVLRDGRLLEVDVHDGRTTDENPFPGFDPADWVAHGVVRTHGTGALLMSAVGDESRLALAWPGTLVRTAQHQQVTALPVDGSLLGIAGDWVLVLDQTCPGEDCVLRTVQVAPGRIDVGEVAPPTGWSFNAGPIAGHPPGVLVPVRSLEGTGFALARLVTRFDQPVVLPGSNGVLLRAGLVDGPDGTVYLLAAGRPFSNPEVLVWDPTVPYTMVRLYTFRVGFGAELVCVCG
jgi:hypothetical protein